MRLIRFSVLAFAGIIALVGIAFAQEPLLELPGASGSSGGVPVNRLELLSPDEITDLYDSPTPAPAPTAPPVKEVVVEPVTQPDLPPQLEPQEPKPADSYADLLEDLDSDVIDPSADNVDINQVWSHPSIMMPPKEVKIFNSAIARYQKSLIEPVIEVVQEVEEEPIDLGPPPGNYPFITVDSIMYINNTNWAAWINGTRFAPNKTEQLPGITIQSITRDSVTLHWRKPAPRKIKPKQQVNLDNPFVIVPAKIREQFEAEKKAEASNPEPKEPIVLPPNVIKVDDKQYIITLSPNQALITEDFTVVEGRVASKRVAEIYELQEYEKRQQAGPEEVAETKAEPEMSEEEKREQEDLAKLLELYRNSGIGKENDQP